MSTAIKIENLSKRYIIGHKNIERYSALRDVIANGVANAGRRALDLVTGRREHSNDSKREEFWALEDINFEIQQGERVGIIGRNGAGKSTLLKVLSRITEPTRGKVSLNGRVASLLEVGTGFHPELTGRENIFLNAAILGMSRAEIKNRFDEIVEFAEIEKFLDTPVKRYSSGMYVRLAFSVAAHLEPEILIVDEVLAVGDAQFQKKCLSKMSEVGADGRTVLFVSHNMTAIKSLCEKAIWLDTGTVRKIGDVENVVNNYLKHSIPTRTHQTWKDPIDAPGNEKVKLRCSKISYKGQETGESITVNTPVNLEFEFWNLKNEALLNFSIQLFNDQDLCVFSTVSDAKRFPEGVVKGICHIPSNLLNDGVYRVRLQIIQERSLSILKIDEALAFEVHDVAREGQWYGKWIGAVRPKLAWNLFFEEIDPGSL